jgi:hypothetical protein
MQRQNAKRGTRKKTIRRQSQKAISQKSNYITNYQAPESIVKILLDKIITLSIRQSTINKIDNQLNTYCFNYIKNQIEPLFEENYMNYTPSNSNINNNNHNNTDTIFWKNKKAEPNHWIEIKEPKSFTNDRFEGAFAHLKELDSKNKKIKINKIKEGLINDNILDKTAEKEASSMEENEKNQNKKSNRKKPAIIENSANKNNNKEENKSKMQINNNINRKVKKIQMVNFPSMDIPGIEKEFMHEVYDPPNIEKLRKERDDEIKKKEKEKKMQIEALKIAKKKDDNEKINKRVKPLDSNKYTFDSNGKIINFKQYKLDNLMKDFAFIKNSIKDDKVKPTKKKNVSIKKESAIKINEDVIKNPTNEEEEKREKSHTDKNNEKKDKIIPSGSNFEIILPNIGVVIKENKKIKEGGREFNKFFNKYSIHDYDKILNEYVPLQNKTKMRNKMEIMNLTQTTTHIQKKISESVDNTRINTSQHNLSNINKTFNFNTDNINMNMNNPLLLNTNDNIQVNINDIDNSNINNNITSSPYLKTSVNSFTKNTNNNYNPLMTSFDARSALISFSQGKRGINMNDSIMMKKPGANSLKLEIESMQDLRNETNYYKYHNIKQKNLFGKNFMKQHRIALIKQIGNNSLASFNKSILTDSNWGNQIGQKIKKKDNAIIAKHHTKQQAIRELGSTFLSGIKVKLPRDRKVEINK